jgi:hypothetical protein
MVEDSHAEMRRAGGLVTPNEDQSCRRRSNLTERQQSGTNIMKTKRTLTIAAVLVALVTLMTLGLFRETRKVHAQEPPPTTVVHRLSFGMIGIAHGQTARLNVTNPDETRPMTINWKLVDSDGEVLHRRDGEPIERTVTLAAGDSAFLQVNADNLLGRNELRLNFRAVVTFHQADSPDDTPLPPDPCLPSVEIINNATGATAFIQSALPAVQRIAARSNN